MVIFKVGTVSRGGGGDFWLIRRVMRSSSGGKVGGGIGWICEGYKGEGVEGEGRDQDYVSNGAKYFE